MVQDSLMLSSEAWFLGRALAGRDWTRGFEDDQDRMREQARELLGGRVSAAIVELSGAIRRFLGVENFFGDLAARRRSPPVRGKP